MRRYGTFSHLLLLTSLVTLLNLAGVFLGAPNVAHAAFGNYTLTLTKDASAAYGTDFMIIPDLTPIGSFGSGGNFTDPGQFFSPRSVAVGPDGSIYVADTDNHRIQKFDAAGQFVNEWGGSGTLEGQLSGPWGIAVGPNGVYVADGDNHRVQQFDAEGEFVRMWGWGVATGANAFEICTSSCLSGYWGGGDGQFGNPRGIAIGPDGSVYVADAVNHRIQKFTADGQFLLKWGTEGTSESQFNLPDGIDVDRNGSVYVAEISNQRVQQFDAEGNFRRMWGWGVATGAGVFEICTSSCLVGSAGSGNGQFKNPRGLEVGVDGAIYVADTGNSRIQQFYSSGDFVRTIAFTDIYDVATGRDGSIFAVSKGNHLLSRWLGAPIVLDNAATVGLGVDDGDEFTSTVQIKGLPAEPYFFFESHSSLWEFVDLQCIGGSFEHAAGNEFLIEIAGSNVNCTLYNEERIGVTLVKEATPAEGTDFTIVPSLAALGTFGSLGSGPDNFRNPWDVAPGENGTLYVADTFNHRVLHLDAAGGLIRQIGYDGSKEGQFRYPASVATSNSSLYVADQANFRIQQFTLNGAFVRMWGWGVATGSDAFEICTSNCQQGIQGSGPGQFSQLVGMATGPGGSTYVADATNQAVQEFSAEGAFIRGWFAGDIVGDVAVAPNGLIYVTHMFSNRIAQFDAGGTFLAAWGWGVATGNAQFEICTSGCQPGLAGGGKGQLAAPQRIEVDRSGMIYVTEFDNNRVQQFDSTGAFVQMWGAGVATEASTALELCTSAADECFSGNGGALNNKVLDAPVGIAIGADGSIYVTEDKLHRISRYLAAAIVLDDADVDDGDAIGNSVQIKGLDTQEYAFSEQLPFGWTMTEADCDTATSSYAPPNFTFQMSNDDRFNGASCVIQNVATLPTLTVNVVVVGGGPLVAANFPVFVDGNAVTRGVATTFSLGQHTVSQTNNAQYTTTIGGDCNSSGVVTLPIGGNLVCTITNTYIPQSLTVNVVVEGGGPLNADNFPLFIDGSAVTRGVAVALVAGQHTVTQSNDPRYAASFSGACNSSGVVTLPIGQNLVCTLTNTLLPVAEIGGVIWQDTNGNGERDEGETGAPGITVSLLTPPDLISAQAVVATTTNNNGEYLFDELASGNYQVSIAPPAGMEFAPTGEAGSESDAQQALLTLTASAAPTSTLPGTTITYQLNYTNSGALAANGIVISTTLPANTTIDLSQNAGWSCQNGAVVAGTPCTLAAAGLAAGASALATLQLEVSAQTETPTTVALSAAIRHLTPGVTAAISLPPAGSNTSVDFGLVPVNSGRVSAVVQTVVESEAVSPSPQLMLPSIYGR